MTTMNVSKFLLMDVREIEILISNPGSSAFSDQDDTVSISMEDIDNLIKALGCVRAAKRMGVKLGDLYTNGACICTPEGDKYIVLYTWQPGYYDIGDHIVGEDIKKWIPAGTGNQEG